jgi:hypothetical protein
MRTRRQYTCNERAELTSQGASISATRYALLAFLLAATANACAASSPARSTALKGTLDLAKQLPAPTGTPFGLTYHPQAKGSAGQMPGSRAEIEAFLQRSTVAVPRTITTASQERPPSSRPHTQAVLKSGGSRAGAPERAGEIAAAAAEVRLAGVISPSVAADAQRYAQRQRTAQQQERYRGGDVVVIGASTLLIVVLIVVLLIILL